MEICTVVTRDREEMVDITERLCAVIREKGWRHGIKVSLMGPSLFVIVEDGEPRLGTWQSVYLYEGDGPRSRSIWVQWLPASENA